jgi:hypothetical protein
VSWSHRRDETDQTRKTPKDLRAHESEPLVRSVDVGSTHDRQTLDSPKSFLTSVFEPFLKTFRKSTSLQYILHFRSGTEEMSRKLLMHETLNIGSKLTTQTMKRLEPSLPPKQGKAKKNIKLCYPTILCFPESYNMGLGVTQWCFPDNSQITLMTYLRKIAVFHVHRMDSQHILNTQETNSLTNCSVFMK